MKAIIPVAGVGTRLRPHTYTLPKVLLNVAGKPILGHILDALQAHEIDEATIIVGYMGDLVEEYVRKHHTLKVNFIYQEERLGLGHSISGSPKTALFFRSINNLFCFVILPIIYIFTKIIETVNELSI